MDFGAAFFSEGNFGRIFGRHFSSACSRISSHSVFLSPDHGWASSSTRISRRVGIRTHRASRHSFPSPITGRIASSFFSQYLLSYGSYGRKSIGRCWRGRFIFSTIYRRIQVIFSQPHFSGLFRIFMYRECRGDNHIFSFRIGSYFSSVCTGFSSARDGFEKTGVEPL